MDKSEKTLYDLKELRITASGDDDFMAEMITLFIEQNEMCIREADVLFGLKDFAGIKKLLHKIKPSAIVMGVSIAVEIIKQIEQMDVKSVDEPLLKELLEKLAGILRTVNIQLQTR